MWQTDEPCPACGAALVLLGHGEPVQVTECRSCGHSERWDFDGDTNGGGAG